MQRDEIAKRDDGLVVVTLGPGAVRRLPPLLRRLIVVVERPRRWPSPDRQILQRMFPDAYSDRAESRAFRSRHDAGMRASVAAATHRLLASLDETAILELDAAAQVDFFIAIGAARWLYAYRLSIVESRTAAWLQYMHDQLATASEPGIAEFIKDRHPGLLT